MNDDHSSHGGHHHGEHGEHAASAPAPEAPAPAASAQNALGSFKDRAASVLAAMFNDRTFSSVDTLYAGMSRAGITSDAATFDNRVVTITVPAESRHAPLPGGLKPEQVTQATIDETDQDALEYQRKVFWGWVKDRIEGGTIKLERGVEALTELGYESLPKQVTTVSVNFLDDRDAEHGVTVRLEGKVSDEEARTAALEYVGEHPTQKLVREAFPGAISDTAKSRLTWLSTSTKNEWEAYKA